MTTPAPVPSSASRGGTLRALEGAWRIALGRNDWRECFDFSADGFFNSFFALIVAAPLFLLIFAGARPAQEEYMAILEPSARPPSSSVSFVFTVITYVGGWAASILALAATARIFKAPRNFAVVVVLFNWTRPVLLSISCLAATAYLLGLISAGQFLFVQLAALAWNAFVTVRVVRGGFGVRMAAAIATTVGLFAASLAVELVTLSFAPNVAQG
ncbi:MAG: hypothetical protein AAGH48_00425 [Pseudomonadota bacterium]